MVSLTSVRADRLYNNYNLTETLTRNEEIKGLAGGFSLVTCYEIYIGTHQLLLCRAGGYILTRDPDRKLGTSSEETFAWQHNNYYKHASPPQPSQNSHLPDLVMTISVPM